MNRTAPAGSQRLRHRHRLLGEAPVLERDQDAAVLDLGYPEWLQRLDLDGLPQWQILAAAEEQIGDYPEDHPRGARDERRQLERYDHDPGSERADAADNGGDREPG